MPSIFEIRCMDHLKLSSCFSHGDIFTNSDDFALVFTDIKNNQVELSVFYRGYLLNSLSIEQKSAKSILLFVYVDTETDISIEVEGSSSNAPSKNIACIEFYSKDSCKRCLNLLSNMGVVRRRQGSSNVNFTAVERELDVDLCHSERPKYFNGNSQLEENMEKVSSGLSAFIKNSRRKLTTLEHDSIIFSQLINLQFNRKEMLRLKCDNFQRFQNLQLKHQVETDLQLEILERGKKSKNESHVETCKVELKNILENAGESSIDEINIGEPVSDGSPNMESYVDHSSKLSREELKRKNEKPGLLVELHSPSKAGNLSPLMLAGTKKDSEFKLSPPRYITHARIPTALVSTSNTNKPFLPLVPRTIIGESEIKLLRPHIQFRSSNQLRSERFLVNKLVNTRYAGKSIDRESIEKLNSNCF